ncbi:flagellar motor protein MotB [Novispirillum sp. DQ9]|uniref:flagellar motor protein MotB n=1 Tax=Novispirillum sp. DQ9 TaxID=3398612 RepID=UPI003C7D3DC8
MADELGKQAIIVKKIKKGHAGAHGGAWKVAYADFVTAMMAFFLLLWLLNSVTEEQLQGISNYFSPTTVSQSPSGAGGMLGGQVIGQGASQSSSAQPTITMNLPPSTIGAGGEDFTDPAEGAAEEDFDGRSEKQHEAAMREAMEQRQFEQVAQDLRNAVQSVPQLQGLKDSLLVDNTPEGLRIQIVDQEGAPMFPAGSSAMYEHTRALLQLVGRVVRMLPQKIAVDGHTDATSFADASGYGNWELSADRALASRRVLLGGGVTDDRIARVSGKAGSEPLLADQPNHPRNRRISVILLREAENTGEEPKPLGPPPIPSISR